MKIASRVIPEGLAGHGLSTTGVALLNNANHMRPMQIRVRQTQNLPVTSDEAACLRTYALG